MHVLGVLRERFVEHTKKKYGPIPKTFPVGPIHGNILLRQASLSHHGPPPQGGYGKKKKKPKSRTELFS